MTSFISKSDASFIVIKFSKMNFLMQFMILSLFIFFVEPRYEVIMDRIEQMDYKIYWDLGTVQIRRFNRSTWVKKIGYLNKLINSLKLISQHLRSWRSFTQKTHWWYLLYLEFWICFTVLCSRFEFLRFIKSNLWKNYFGNERWKVIGRVLKDGKVCGARVVYAILRDNQKLFDSKWWKVYLLKKTFKFI